MTASAMHDDGTPMTPDEWWIATDLRRNDGKKLLGPFDSRDLASEVRFLYETVNAPQTFAIDTWPAGSTPSG